MVCEVYFVLSYGIELRGCVEDYIYCVLELVLEGGLEKGKEKKKEIKNDENL